MAIQDIIQRFQTQGEDRLKQAYLSNAQSAGKMEAAVESLDKAVKDSARVYQDAAAKYGVGSTEAEKAAQAFRKASSTLDQAKSDFAETANIVDKASEKMEAAQQKIAKLENLRNTGAALAASGAGVMLLSERLIGAGLEADRLNSKMGALLGGAQMTGATDQIKGIAEELAGLTGGDDDTIAAAISQAVVTGRARALTEFGIVVSKSGQEAITAAYKISDLAGRQETLRQVTEAASRAIGDLRANTSEAAQAIGEATVKIENMQENIGLGAAAAKAEVAGLVMSLLGIAENSPDGQRTFGSLLYYAGLATSAIGGTIGLVGQIGLAKLALTGFGATAATTGATTAGAFATITGGATAAGAAIAALAAPIALAATAIGGFYVAYKGSIDAASMDADRLREKWGALGALWVSLADKISSPDVAEDTDPRARALFQKLQAKAPYNPALARAVTPTATATIAPTSPAAAFVAPTGITNTRAGFDAPAARRTAQTGRGMDSRTISSLRDTFSTIGAIFGEPMPPDLVGPKPVATAPALSASVRPSGGFDPAGIARRFGLTGGTQGGIKVTAPMPKVAALPDGGYEIEIPKFRLPPPADYASVRQLARDFSAAGI